ncbi:MAG: F0F1 ATP synthase subunit C [Pseudomonadota bacterium]
MTGDIAEFGQYLGAGLACIAMAGAGIGVGNVAGNFLNGALRNPAAAKDQQGNFFVGMAFAEALGIFGLVVALLLIFVV